MHYPVRKGLFRRIVSHVKAVDEINFSKNLLSSQPQDTKDSDKSFTETFVDKYYRSSSSMLYFFESIYNYVAGASEFILDHLIEEINTIFHVKNEKILPEYELLTKIDHRNYYKLTNKEYTSCTRKVLEYAAKGKYKIIEYFQIFQYLMRFENNITSNKEEIKRIIFKGINNAKYISSYIHSLNTLLTIPKDPNYLQDYKEIKEAIIKANNEILKEQVNKSCIEMARKTENDLENISIILSDRSNEWWTNPFLHYASVHKIYLLLINSENNKIHEFAIFINYRFNPIRNEDLKVELKFLEDLKKKLIPTTQTREKTTLKNYLLNLVSDRIDQAITNLKSIN